ncbi:MAG: SCO family protein [Candidatus Zixiibacteriota bacterium]
MPVLVAIMLLAGIVFAQVVEQDPSQLRDIDIIEHLGDTIPLDIAFTDDRGQTIKLETYFHRGRPVILHPGYYTCPMLCNLVMNGLAAAAKEIPWLPGKEFQIVSFSIDPTETPLVAAAKKKNYLKAIGKPDIESGWDFLTGDSAQSRALADAIGFKYYYDEDQKQYAHAAVLVIVTEDGRISRYLYGIEFRERDLKLALVEASEGRVGSTLDRLILYCYHYDPRAGGYVVFAGNIMRLGGLLTLIILAAFLTWLWLRDRRRKTLARFRA